MTEKVLSLFVKAGTIQEDILKRLDSEYDALEKVENIEIRDYARNCIMRAIIIILKNPILLEKGFRAYIRGRNGKLDITLNNEIDLYWFDDKEAVV